MKLLIQRVTQASVTVNDQLISTIGKGMLVLLGIHLDDDKPLAKKMAQKLPKVRLWNSLPIQGEESKDEGKPWSSSVADNGFEIIVVSQFTLYNTMKGTKPDFHLSKNSVEAKEIYDYFLEELRKCYNGQKVFGGAFQQYMNVQLVNDGPVTIEIEEKNQKVQQKKEKKENSKDQQEEDKNENNQQ